MAPLSFRSGVKHVQTLLVRSVSSLQATICHHFLPARPRCFRVSTGGRRRHRDLEACSLDELLQQAARLFLVSGHRLTVVLEEDGTVVESDDFFQTLPSNTALMVLETDGWRQNGTQISPQRNSVAKVTFDLYKLQPRDFLCCLAVGATLHGVNSLSYDFRCTKVKQVVGSLLRCLTCVTRLTGQLLIAASASLLHAVAGGDDDGVSPR